MIAVELYGVPRMRAGTKRLAVDASTIGQALRELGRLCPALESTVLKQGALESAYQLNLNGERFVSDPATALRDGDVLLLLSADVGG